MADNRRPDDLSTATLRRQDRPNRLIVEKLPRNRSDTSVVHLSRAKMEQLGLVSPEFVLLRGKRETVCLAMSNENCPDEKIRMNSVVRYNLRVRLSGVVSVKRCPSVEEGNRVDILPIDDSVECLTGFRMHDCNLLLATPALEEGFDLPRCNLVLRWDVPASYLLGKYFAHQHRPIHRDDTIVVRSGMRAVKFKVLQTDPGPCCVVYPDTVIICNGEPIDQDVS